MPGPDRRTRALPPHAGRQPRHHRGRRSREARRGARRELHRPRGRGLAARAGARGPRRGSRTLARSDACSVRSLVISFGRSTKSMAWCSISSGRRADRRRERRARERRRIPADLVVVGIGVQPESAISPKRPASNRIVASGERVPGDERARRLRRGRHRPLARPAHRRVDPGRALGGGPAQGQAAAQKHPRARASRSMRCRSSGARTTICRSATSGTRSAGMPSRSTGTWTRRDCAVRYMLKGRAIAAATVGRDIESLRFEARADRDEKVNAVSRRRRRARHAGASR